MNVFQGIAVVALLAGAAASGPYLGQTPPGVTPEPFTVVGITPDHSVPVFAPDRVEVYWSQRTGADEVRRIHHSYFSRHGWSPPQVVSFSGRWDGDCPLIAPDGRQMIFNSNRPLAAEGGSRRERLWTVSRTGSDWSSPRALPVEINGDHLHWQASVDTAGNVYFGADRFGGQGRDDIFVSRRSGTGFQPARSLAPPVNTACHESTPFVSPDGDYLLFARTCYGEHPPDVPTGLLVSFRLSDGTWSVPVPVPLAGVQAADAVCPTVTPDGRFLFFLVLNQDLRQIYWVDASVVRDRDPRP